MDFIAMVIDIVGSWRIKEVQLMDSDLNVSWRTVDDILADDSVEESDKRIYRGRAIFKDNGELCMACPLPDGVTKADIAEELESGEVEMCGESEIIYEKFPWKEEGGKILFDSGAEGEVLGVKVSPWVEITECDGGICLFMYKLVKE